MADLLDLSGKRLESAPEPNQVLATLKGLVARIEAGEITPDHVYVLYQEPNADPALVDRLSVDSGLTVERAVLWLEAEKWRLMSALMGVPHA